MKTVIQNNRVRSTHEVGRHYDGSMLDITGAGTVEISVARAPSGKVVWVNVDGLCVLRVCRIKGRTTVTQ